MATESEGREAAVCANCSHSREDHDDGRKHCCWYEERTDGFAGWCACTKFLPAPTAPPPDHG